MFLTVDAAPVSCLDHNPEPLLLSQGQESSLQRRQVIFDHVPDRVPVDSKIVVDKDVPHRDDRR